MTSLKLQIIAYGHHRGGAPNKAVLTLMDPACSYITWTAIHIKSHHRILHFSFNGHLVFLQSFMVITAGDVHVKKVPVIYTLQEERLYNTVIVPQDLISLTFSWISCVDWASQNATVAKSFRIGISTVQSLPSNRAISGRGCIGPFTVWGLIPTTWKKQGRKLRWTTLKFTGCRWTNNCQKW